MNEAPTPEQNRQGMHLVVDVIEFIFDNGPDIEWPRWKSTGDLTIPELADKCLRTVKAHVKHNIDTTDWSSSTIGAPPANLMEVASEVNEQFRNYFEITAQQIREQESLAPGALAVRMLTIIRQSTISGILSREIREVIPERSRPVCSDVCNERGYQVDMDYIRGD